LTQSDQLLAWSSVCHCHPIISRFSKIQIGLTFLVLAYPGCPGKMAVKQVSVSVYLSGDKKKAKLKTDHCKTDDFIPCFAFQRKCNFACVDILAFECTLRYRRICSWTVVFRIQKTAWMLASWCATSTRVAGSAVSCITLLTVSSWRMAPIELWSYLHTAGVTLRVVAGKNTFCPSVKLVLIAWAEASLGQVCVTLWHCLL